MCLNGRFFCSTTADRRSSSGENTCEVPDYWVHPNHPPPLFSNLSHSLFVSCKVYVSFRRAMVGLGLNFVRCISSGRRSQSSRGAITAADPVIWKGVIYSTYLSTYISGSRYRWICLSRYLCSSPTHQWGPRHGQPRFVTKDSSDQHRPPTAASRVRGYLFCDPMHTGISLWTSQPDGDPVGCPGGSWGQTNTQAETHLLTQPHVSSPREPAVVWTQAGALNKVGVRLKCIP